MTWLNIVLGLASAVMWIGTVVYYFKKELRTFWSHRHDRWFRQD